MGVGSLGLARQLVTVFRRVGFQPVNEKTGWKPILRLTLALYPVRRPPWL